MDEGVQHGNLIVLLILYSEFDGGNDHCVVDISALKFNRRRERGQGHIFKMFHEKIGNNGANR